MKSSKLSLLSKLILFVSAALLIVSIFVPIWRIELDAPQYPEGLVLKIYADKLGGNVEVINGLNHYIGMKTLHTDDFIEFTILPYIIGVIALFFCIAAIRGTKRWLYASFTLILLFGIVAMIDFWQWEYNYGHNLDPNAAIIVPGMAYQPPLIGFKQLLNFGAFSIPDIGGWLFVATGVLLLLAVCKESGLFSKNAKRKKGVTSVVIAMLFLQAGCSNREPEPIALNKDMCDNCRMVIADGKFGAEVITGKGRVYKFDDLRCMNAFVKEKADGKIEGFFIHDFTADNVLINASSAFYVHHENIRSPMGGNTAAFSKKNEAEELASQYSTQISSWEQVQK